MTDYTNYEEIPIQILRGDSKAYVFDIKDTDGDAIDLSSYTFTCQGRTDYDSNTTLWSVTLTDGSDGNDFENGRLALKLSTTVTEDLPRTGYFDIVGSDNITRVRGRFTVLLDVTRS